MGPTARAALVDFVNGGGVAYIGVDGVGDGPQIASAFGFTLADRASQKSLCTVTDATNPISAGPFHPSGTFVESTHGRFTGSPPSGGSFIGSGTYGNLLAYRTLGAGRLYLFADEVPLYADLSEPVPEFAGQDDHLEMFENVLVAAGASVIPPPPPLTATNSFLQPQRIRAKLRPNPGKSLLLAKGVLDTGSAETDLAAAAQVLIGGLTIDIPGFKASANGRRLRYAGPGLSVRLSRGAFTSSKAKFALRRTGDLTGAIVLDQAGSGRVDLGLTSAAFDARSTTAVTAGQFRFGAVPGALSSPSLYLRRATGKVLGGGQDSLSLLLGFAGDGTTPAAATDVRLALGPNVDVTISASEFAPAGDLWVFTGNRGGITQVTIDHRKETIAITCSAVDLSALDAASNSFEILVERPTEARSVAVRLARVQSSLRY
jgi:hypothetical protein